MKLKEEFRFHQAQFPRSKGLFRGQRPVIESIFDQLPVRSCFLLPLCQSLVPVSSLQLQLNFPTDLRNGLKGPFFSTFFYSGGGGGGVCVKTTKQSYETAIQRCLLKTVLRCRRNAGGDKG